VRDSGAGQDADTAWRTTVKTVGKGEARWNGGFLDEYIEALGEQVRQNKKGGGEEDGYGKVLICSTSGCWPALNGLIDGPSCEGYPPLFCT
jgi:hypothetical protein